MDPIVLLLILSLAAGMAIPLGGILGTIDQIYPRWLEEEFRHGVIAFGGGALLSAVALVLVPEGVGVLSPWMVALSFILGGVVFMRVDMALAARDSPASQLLAMLADFIPECLALGAAFAVGGGSASLLAVLVAIQNLPEGFNAFRELSVESGIRARRVVGAFALMALLGPISAYVGYAWLADQPRLVGCIMLFASGGILYVVFQDIAPQAKLVGHGIVPLGAVIGFLVGVLGQMLLPA